MHNIIISDAEILGGTPIFSGSRVPFSYLMEYLERGLNIESFLEDYPSVNISQARGALEEASLLVDKLVRGHSS